MQTLRELFKEISVNNKRWSYYRDPSVSIYRKWDSFDGVAALNFIKDYFNLASKSNVFNDVQLKKQEAFIRERSNHIISTYLLGIKIAESLNIDCDIGSDDGFNFKYYWFLTCLYHDIGYAYENSSTAEQLKMLQTDGLDAIQQICDIKYLDERVFRSLSREHVEIYLKGRAMGQNGHRAVIDHGIVAGLLMYDRLCKQFEESWRRRTNKNDTRTSFYVKAHNNRVLHLSNNHYDAYAIAADAIIRHNVFNDTLNSYIEHVESNKVNFFNERITISNKLGFVLGISDTIEPLKKGMQYLDSVKIESLKKAQGIRIVVNKEVYQKLYSNIKDLSTWLCVKVNVLIDEIDVTIEIMIDETRK